MSRDFTTEAETLGAWKVSGRDASVVRRAAVAPGQNKGILVASCRTTGDAAAIVRDRERVAVLEAFVAKWLNGAGVTSAEINAMRATLPALPTEFVVHPDTGDVTEVAK